jgi:hypothetical protein
LDAGDRAKLQARGEAADNHCCETQSPL